MTNRVCAVVVTHNRKNLLIECLESLLNQTYKIEGVYLVDNASTDGTPELMLEKGYITSLPPKDLKEPWEREFNIRNLSDGRDLKLHYVRMPINTGGAGGFSEGVRRGYEKGYDWLWLMDDDTITTPNALSILLEKAMKLSTLRIGFLCSKVIWIDETPHIMNIPLVRQFVNNTPFNFYDDDNVFLVESTSFVSLLLNRSAVKCVGFPIKEFFIYADDVEYTLRITKNGFVGLYVKDSIVIHKTETNYASGELYDWRFYFNIRNNLWAYKLHDKKMYLLHLLNYLLKIPRIPFRYRCILLKACIVSLIQTPRIQYC